VAGAVLGARVAPGFLDGGGSSGYTGLVALGGAVVGAVLLRAGARFAGSFVRGGLRLLPPLHALDSVGGLAVGAVWGLALVWVAGAVALQLPRHAPVRDEVKTSNVIKRLNEIAPPRDLLHVELRPDRLRLPLDL
jgi:hypothetical protein